jgi:hypothetical protein
MDLSVHKINSGSCTHTDAGLYRVMYADGRGYHVAQMCPDCRENTRGPAVWIPRSEVVASGIDPESLPVWRRAPKQKEATLFDALGGGEGQA